jgi:hypothetical protein
VAFAQGLPPNAPSTDAFYESLRTTLNDGDGLSFVAGITVGLQQLASTDGPDQNGYGILLERVVNTTADAVSQVNDEMKATSEQVKDLNAELARLVSTFGTGMSDADRQRAIDQFKNEHQAEYDAYEAAGRRASSMLPGLALIDQDPTFQRFEGNHIRQVGDELAGQIGDISGTRAGSEAIAEALVAEGEGRPTFIDGLKALSESKEGAQAILRGAAQAAIEFAGKGDAEGLKAILEGLRRNPKLFGLEQEDMDTLTEVLGRFQPGMTDAQLSQTSAELKGDIEGLEAEGKLPKDGALTQSLKGLGVVFGLFGATKDLVTGFGSANFEDKVKLVADQLGADAGAGTFVLEALGKASEALKTFGAATAAISGVISAFEALDLFAKGKVAEGITSSASAIGGLLLTAGELGLEVPGLQVVGGVLIVLGAVGELVVNWFESNEREAKFEKDAEAFLLAGGVPPRVAHLLAKDVDDQGNNAGPAMNALAAQYGLTSAQFYAWLATQPDATIQKVIDASHHLKKNADGSFAPTSPADQYAGPGHLVGGGGKGGGYRADADPQSLEGFRRWLAFNHLAPGA